MKQVKAERVCAGAATIQKQSAGRKAEMAACEFWQDQTNRKRRNRFFLKLLVPQGKYDPCL